MNCKYRITYKGKCWHHCFMRINVIRESRLGNRTGSTAYRISPNLHKSQPACTDQMSLYNSSKAMKLAHIPICKYIHMQNKKKNASFTTLKNTYIKSFRNYYYKKKNETSQHP